jgi:hypothetical protein
MNRFDEYSVDELKEALKTAMLYSDLNDDAVIEEMDEILAVLRKKAPFPHPHTTEEMWAEFQAEHADELAALGVRENGDTGEVMEKSPEVDVTVVRAESKPAKAKGLKPFLRVGLIAAIVVVLMLAITVTASAFGLNLWGWVPKWTDEVLSFSKEDPEEPVIKNIPMVLQALEITEPLYPTWLPEGFVLAETFIETDPFVLHDAYVRNDDYLAITISSTSAYTANYNYQKDDAPFIEYISNGIIHYVFSDLNFAEVTWNTNNYTVHITGNISEDDMKNIIDSVYKEKK